MERRRLVSPPANGGDYFPESGRPLDFIPSGCAVLDCVLGGGWPLGRVENIVGDRSTGKTLLAIEACSNLLLKYPEANVWYREAEAAFDEHYARHLGIPMDRIDFGPNGLDTYWDTIEDIWEDLEDKLAICQSNGQPALYIVDSLDALSSRAAGKREVGQGSYNLEKQKILSQMFSETVRKVKATRMCLVFVSQVRDRIGPMIVGDKHRRSGGKSLDFYATHILWLSHLKTLVQKVKGMRRAYGVRIKAKTRKNKIAMPYRDCEFTIRFGFGVEDVEASVLWLEATANLGMIGLKKKDVDDYLADTDELNAGAYRERAAELRKVLFRAWGELEDQPTRRKYG